jgi:hypothetical protein
MFKKKLLHKFNCLWDSHHQKSKWNCQPQSNCVHCSSSRGDRGYVGHGATLDIAVLSMFP